MTFDEILEQIGDFGPYQKRSYYFLCTPAIVKATILMSAVFVLQLPEFRCAIPGLGNDTFRVQDEYHEYLINRTLPPAPARECTFYENRTLTTQQLQNYSARIQAVYLVDQLSTCDSWVYDTSEVHSSMLTEAMKSHASMGFFCGSLVGAVLIGGIADTIGRKKALLLCVAIQVVFGISLYFISSMVAVVVVRLIQGVAGVMFAISVSTGMELVGPSKRTFAGMVVQFFWIAGQLVVVLVSYLSKDWRVSELVYGLCAVPVFVMACLAPESPRWLIDRKRYTEAEKILRKIAESNKTTFPETDLRAKTGDLTTPKIKISEFLSTRILMITYLIVFFNWFAVNFLYSGLNFNLNNLSGSLYLNFLFSVAVETLGFLVSLVLLDRTGRKCLHMICIFVGGVACLAVNVPVAFGNEDHQWIITALAMIGKMMASCCYSIMYIMSVEIFPTVVRNSALGVCSVFENLGGMVSPYIADLGILVGGSLSKTLPTTVFGGVALLAAFLSLLLPETLHQPMPETLEDVVKLFSQKRSSKRVYVVNDWKLPNMESHM